MNELEQAARQAYEHRRRDYGSVNENAIYFAATFARQQVEARVAELDKWRIAYESLTPLGSEFVNDLNACSMYVQHNLVDALHLARKNWVKSKRRVAELAQQVERYRAALEHYADRDRWTSRTGKTEGTVKDWYWGENGSDNGFDVARAALKDKE